MSRYTNWIQNSLTTEEDYFIQLRLEKMRREELIFGVQHDLASLGASLGQNSAQIATQVDLLFTTFSSDWALYALTGSPAILSSIQNDVTIPWLDLDVSGATIRQRLLNRLS